ncbi:MFS transporter [Yinghuangia aomiensis]|uniref:MFS transporter n=2 Tax=Yinghuangia aomiensis TaxID=676205 RepID=A0ABP9GM39_9ACTN
MAPLALAFGALQVGGTATDLGIVLAAGMVSETLLPLVGGVIGDRYPPRVVQVAGYRLLGLLQATSAVLLLTGAMRVPYLIALAVLVGAVTALSASSGANLIPKTLPEPLQGAGVALMSAGINTVKIGGPAVGGLLIAAAGPGWAAAIDAASFLAAAAFITRLRVADPPRTEPSVRESVVAGWAEFRRYRAVVYLTVSGAFVVPLWLATYLVLGPTYAVDRLGGAAGWGTVVTAFTAGLVTGAAVCLKRPPVRPGWTTCVSAAVMAGPPMAMAANAPLAVLVAATFAVGAALNTAIIVWQTWTQQTFAIDVLNRLTAITGTGQRALVPAAYLAAGPTADRAGMHHTLAAAGVLLIAAAAFPLAAACVRGLRVRPPAVPDPRTPELSSPPPTAAAADTARPHGPPGHASGRDATAGARDLMHESAPTHVPPADHHPAEERDATRDHRHT